MKGRQVGYILSASTDAPDPAIGFSEAAGLLPTFADRKQAVWDRLHELAGPTTGKRKRSAR